MTRKDFELIAKTIREARLSHSDRVNLAWDFANVLSTTNPRFDEYRFVIAATKDA